MRDARGTATLPVRLTIGRRTIELGQVEVSTLDRSAEALDAVSDATVELVADLLEQAITVLRAPRIGR